MVLTATTVTSWWQRDAPASFLVALPLVETNVGKPCKIAQQEIDAGKIQFIVDSRRDEPAPRQPSAARESK
jgi:hypothetical protein